MSRHRRVLWALGAVAALAAPAARASEGPHATSYVLDVRCRPEESSLRGVAVIGLREAGQAARTLHFWLHGELRVTRVEAAGRELDYTEDVRFYDYDYALVGNRVEVSLATGSVPESIEVEWEGSFHPSRARSASDYMRIDASGVFLRALGYSAWFPILLEPDEEEHDVAFPRVSVTVPRGWTAVVTGEPVGSEALGDSTRFTWRAESASLFDAQLTARPFRVASAAGVTVYSLRDPDSLAAGEVIEGLARSLLAYFRDHYRTDALSGTLQVVEMPAFGDISSGDVVGIQESRWRAFAGSAGTDGAAEPDGTPSSSEQVRRTAAGTLAHELVHPFVQPPIPRTDPLYALMIEGFPSYFHFPALEALGLLKVEERMSEIRRSYLEKRTTGQGRRGRPLPAEKALSAIGADEIGVYKDRFVLADRALLFLDTLRTRMGSETFFSFTRRLFASDAMDDATFRSLVVEYLPGFAAEMRTWLDTTDLPAELAESSR